MKIFEIGVGEYVQCRTLQYLNTNTECYLFEPNPISFQQLASNLSQHPNFKLFNYAVGAENKTVNLYIARGSSFIEGAESPEKSFDPNSESRLEKTSIEIKNIQDIDPGDIDLLLLDTEGTEFDIIRNLISRPKEISVEMYSFGVKYKNPYFNEISEWMKNNNYTIVSQDEDFIFKLNE